MKKIFSFLAAAISVILFSCGSGSETEQTKDTGSQVAVIPEVNDPAPFTPFDVVRVHFTVKNYEKWHTGFMSHDSIRLANGIHKYVIQRGLGNDSNMIMVVSKIDDMQKAKAFYASPEVKKFISDDGIISKPEFEYLHVIRNDTATVAQDQRVSIVHHVKNFDAWVKVYDDEGKDTRAANGIIDRAMARGMEDSNMVSVIFIVTDMDKAKARAASPDLKKLMTDAGVDSAPVITFYRIAEKF